MPRAARIDTACALAASVMISPAQGAMSIPPVGSMARPSPSMRPANTGSGTSSSELHQPSNGARICRIDIRRLLPDLDPVQRPLWVEVRTREAQAHIMPAWNGGQPLRGQDRHAFIAGGRCERQSGNRRLVATVDVNFQFTLRRACVADPNLGGVRTDLVIKR